MQTLNTYKISLIIPVFNVEQYVGQCIQSILTQTMPLKDLQIIFVDDGSSDRSVDIIQSYRQQLDFELIQLNGPSGAAGKPRNIGLERAQGKYCVFLDPDDLLLENGLIDLYTQIELYQSDIATSKFIAFNDLGSYDSFANNANQSFLKQTKVNFSIEQHPELLQLPNNLCSKIFSTAFLLAHDITFPVGVIAQDTYFVTKAYLLTDSITYFPSYVFKYRVRNDLNNPSVSQKINLKYFQDFSYIRKLLIELYDSQQKVNYFQVRYYNELRFLLYQIQRAYSISLAEKIQCLKEITWFVELHDRVKTDELDATRKLLIQLIVQQQYEEAAQHMIIDPIAFHKQKAKEIFNSKQPKE